MGRTSISLQRYLETRSVRDYELPMEHLQLVHENLQEDENKDTFAATTAVGDPLNDSPDNLYEYSISVAVPSFILEYRIDGTTPPSTNDFENVENHTKTFITEQLEKSLNRRGVGIAENLFACIWGGTRKSADSFDIAFAPVFLFDSTWSDVPSEVDLARFLINLFSGDSLEEYLSSLSTLDTSSAFAATTSVVFRRSHHSNEEETVNSPYFAGACAGIVTLLILFLWNQSMRVRSLMKEKARGIESESISWSRRRYVDGCEDEEQCSLGVENNCNRWGTNRDFSDRDDDSSSDESFVDEAFRSPLFPCPSEFENSFVERLCIDENKRQGRTCTHWHKRCDTPCEKSASSGASAKFSTSDKLSEDRSYCERIAVSTSLQRQSPHKNGGMNSICGKLYDPRGPETRTNKKASERRSSCSSSDKSYKAETSKMFEQLEHSNSTLDSIFGALTGSKKSKESTRNLQKRDKKSSYDSHTMQEKSLVGMECDWRQSQFEEGKLSKESTVWAEGSKSSDDWHSCSDYSLVEEAFDSTCGSELSSPLVHQDENEEEGVNGSIRECSPSGEPQASSFMARQSSRSQQTRLHAWLINQGQHIPLFCGNSDGLVERHTETKAILPSVDEIEQEYRSSIPNGSENCNSRYSSQYWSTRVWNTTKSRQDRRTRRNVRNGKMRLAMDYKRKPNCATERTKSPEHEIVDNDSFSRNMKTQEFWTAKRTPKICEGKQQKNHIVSAMTEEGDRTALKPLEKSAYAAASCIHHRKFIDRSTEAKGMEIDRSQSFSQTRMDPKILLQELKEHLTILPAEGEATKSLPNKFVGMKKDNTNTLVRELKEELSRRRLTKTKAIRVPSGTGSEQESGSKGFIDELKVRLASRALQMNNSEPKPLEKERSVALVSGGLIQELKVALLNREKRVPHYDFSAAESKKCSRAFQNESKLLQELRKKLADRHQGVYGRDGSLTDLVPSQNNSYDEEQEESSTVDNEPQSIERTTMESSSFSHDPRSTETIGTADHSDLDGNVSTISELEEHSVKPTPFLNPQVEDCSIEKNLLPLIVTMRTATKYNENADFDTSGRREDPFLDLSHLKQILESDSSADSESIDPPLGAGEVNESISDIDGNAKYPWEGVGAKNSKENQKLVFDFVSPGKTPTHRESGEADLLSRYKDDILKERMKCRSTERSVNGDHSVGSMPSYKVRMFPAKKEKPDSIPWWLPDETDSSTSLSEATNRDSTNSSTEDDDVSNASSSYDATNSTGSSFLANILLNSNKSC